MTCLSASLAARAQVLALGLVQPEAPTPETVPGAMMQEVETVENSFTAVAGAAVSVAVVSATWGP